jgi:hypothetical protein
MKVTITILAMLLLSSCASKIGETILIERIKDYSYTTARHIENGIDYQVYQTKKGRLYIIKLNRRETRFKRSYLK